MQSTPDIQSLTRDDRLYRIRHSFAHVMAEAVLMEFPSAQLAIGPPIEHGFYYDFGLPRALTQDDLATIEKNMLQIIGDDHPFECRAITREEALQMFRDQQFKLELIHDLPQGEEITLYHQNSFTDLCRGPHVESTRQLNGKSFKLLSVAGSYWRGDEARPMLQRIYGTAWETPKELRSHLGWLEEVAKRDHRVLGKTLDLFSLQEHAGAGLIFWHPKGGRIRNEIEHYWRMEHQKNGYELIYTPHIGKSHLWERSGHLEFYRENMYAPMNIDNTDYYVKPMNCPFHIMIYNNQPHSYRDLPHRWAETGTVYRYERSGVLHGLLRVRGFTQDDAHIFCTPAQAEEEISRVLTFCLQVWKDFGFSDVRAYLATRPAKRVGKDKDWDMAEQALKNALSDSDYEIDEGGGAFYGPKVDLKIKDALSREWQMSTIQFDFNLPERFNMTFVDTDGEEKRPLMIHRALFGSMERFFGVLIEHYGGAFPLWLAPVQAVVIPVTPEFNEYAHIISERLKKYFIDWVHHYQLRIEAWEDNARMNAKIRRAQNEKIPYMLIVGEKERENHTVSLRKRSGIQIPDCPLEQICADWRYRIFTHAKEI